METATVILITEDLEREEPVPFLKREGYSPLVTIMWTTYRNPKIPSLEYPLVSGLDRNDMRHVTDRMGRTEIFRITHVEQTKIWFTVLRLDVERTQTAVFREEPPRCLVLVLTNQMLGRVQVSRLEYRVPTFDHCLYKVSH